LRLPDTTFLIVTTPNRISLEETKYILSKLSDNQLPLGGFIVNKLHRLSQDENQSFEPPDAIHAEEFFTNLQSRDGGAPEKWSDYKPLLIKLIEHYHRASHLARSELSIVKEIRAEAPAGTIIKALPFFDRDIYDLKGLSLVNDHLFS